MNKHLLTIRSIAKRPIRVILIWLYVKGIRLVRHEMITDLIVDHIHDSICSCIVRTVIIPYIYN